MVWKSQIKGDALAWLLAHQDPGVRYLAMRDLASIPKDSPELGLTRRLAHQEGPIAHVLSRMEPEGYWVKAGHGYGPKYKSTVWALMLLAQLGASIHEDPRVALACAYLLDHTLKPGGLFTATGAPSGTIDCLQGNLCYALSELGCEDARLAEAYEWMARSQTGEGIAPVKDKHAPVRYYAYKCGPDYACGANGAKPCAWGAVKVMMAFGSLPAHQRTPLIDRAIARGVDFLLGVDPSSAAYPTSGDQKPNSSWWKFGFPVFYVTDVLQIAEAMTRLGYGGDPRMATLLHLICEKQDTDGRWSMEYPLGSKTWGNYGRGGQPNPWVTIRALRVLKN